MEQIAKEFFKAVKNGDVTEVKRLLATDPSLITVTDEDSSTALHWAAWKGHGEIIDVLLDAGADIEAHNANSHWGTTPLHAAAHGNRKTSAVALIRRGANVNSAGRLGKGTPLAETRPHNATAVAKILWEAGAIE